MILCVGTTPVYQRTMELDQLHIDSVNRARSVVETASGKSLNVARVLHTLGKSTLALGFAGGRRGEALLGDLDRIKLPHRFVPVSAETRMCITIIDRSNGTTTELVEEAPPVEPHRWDVLREHFVGSVKQSKIVVLSGSLPADADPHFYQWCTNEASAHGVQCILDASGDPLRHALASRPFLVKPNRAELAKTLGVPIHDDADLRSSIQNLISLGPRWALVTLGKDGSVLSNGTDFWRISTPPIHAVSPIGSGDSFAAGLASALDEGQSPPESVRLGAACAGANAMIPIAGHLRLQDVHALLPQIRIERW
jgi:tagatose 6-phosphate kinase